MGVFRSLKTLISQSLKTKTHSCSSSISSSYHSQSISSLCKTPLSSLIINSNSSCNRSRHFLFRANLLLPLSSCPLFLSSPPWKLSQLATPLHLQSDVVLGSVKLRALNLINGPIGLHSVSLPPKKKLNDDKEINNGSELSVAVDGIAGSYLNLPNFISFGRLLSGPLLGWMIIQEMYLPAFVGLAISGASDWLDGFMARKMGINSAVGSYLDPLADKVLIGFVALAMVDKGLLHPGLVALVVLRDFALVGGASYKRILTLAREGRSWSDFFDLDGVSSQKVEPLMISKVNTVFQLLLVAAALLQPDYGNEETLPYITYLSWLVALTTIASTAAYGAQHLRNGSAASVKR